MPNYASSYTGSQLDQAIGKALNLDTIAAVSDVTIDSITYHVLWKVAPTASNTVHGFAFHPQNGNVYQITSANNVLSAAPYLTHATEETTLLESDLYAYTPIGKITGASKTNPVKVADAGDPLKEVFNAILGTEEDTNPTINQAGTTFTKTAQTGTITVSGGEVGTAYAAQDGTITYTVTNTATCSYGFKAGSNDTYSKTVPATFYYPIKTRTVTISDVEYSYQIAISYPANLRGCTLSVTAGSLIVDDTTNNILYCNLDASKKVTVKISGMAAGNSTTSIITRFEQLSAGVEFDPAQDNNGTVIDNFWTYLKNAYNNGKTHAAITDVTSTSYIVSIGSYFPYYTQTSTSSAPTGGTKSTEAACYTNGVSITMAADGYMWILTPVAVTKTKLQYYAAGSWNDLATTSGTTTMTLASGATGVTYNYYRTELEQSSGSTLVLRAV